MSIVSQLGHPARIVVLDDDVAFVDALNAALLPSPDLKLIGHTADPRELDALLRELAPDLALVDHSLPRDSGVQVAERVARAFPGGWVFLLTDTPSRALWSEAASRGIRKVLQKPRGLARGDLDAWVAGELLEAVKDTLEEERRQLARLDGAPVAAAGGGERPRVVTAAPRVVAVWDPKGGVGKTTVATNLALYAQTNPYQRVQTALVDLEETSGGTNGLLNMAASPTVLDWLDHEEDEEVDPAAVERRVARHRSGMVCVFQPERLDAARHLSAALARTVIKSLRNVNGLVVVDCAPSVLGTDTVGMALDLANVVLLVVEPGRNALKKTKETVGSLIDLGRLDPSKLRLVVNGLPPRSTITEAEVAAVLELVCWGAIPYDPQALVCENKGTPLAVAAPNGPFMQGLRRVAAKVVPGLEGAALGLGAGGRPRRRFALFGRR